MVAVLGIEVLCIPLSEISGRSVSVVVSKVVRSRGKVSRLSTEGTCMFATPQTSCISLSLSPLSSSVHVVPCSS